METEKPKDTMQTVSNDEELTFHTGIFISKELFKEPQKVMIDDFYYDHTFDKRRPVLVISSADPKLTGRISVNALVMAEILTHYGNTKAQFVDQEVTLSTAYKSRKNERGELIEGLYWNSPTFS